MDALNDLREVIKSYFSDSSELYLSSSYANLRRFNFYFQIAPEQRFLLYLNWDGDGSRFTLKCLEFDSLETLQKLTDIYPDAGSKAFNIGKPRSVVSFFYQGENRLSALEFKGEIGLHIDSREISGNQLLQCVDPLNNLSSES